MTTLALSTDREANDALRQQQVAERAARSAAEAEAGVRAQLSAVEQRCEELKGVSAERLCQTFRGGFRKRGVREPLTPSEVAPSSGCGCR